MKALIQNGEIIKYPYGEWQLLKDNPTVSFPVPVSDDIFAQFGALEVSSSAPPTASLTEMVVEGTPVLISGSLFQQWQVTRKPVPPSVGPAQIRVALRRLHGITANQIQDVIDAIADDSERMDANDLWQYSAEVKRHHPLITAFGQVFGLTSEDIDRLFIFAATI